MTSPSLTATEVAEMAGVGKSAVSNWRRRHADFPRPTGRDSRGVLFDRDEIVAWLRDRGHDVGSVPLAAHLFQLWDRERSHLPPEQALMLTAALIVDAGLDTADRPPHARLHEYWSGLLYSAPEAARERLRAGVDELIRTIHPVGLFEAVLAQRARLTSAKDSGQTTSTALTQLVAALAPPVRNGPVYDPAAGEGALLLEVAFDAPADAAVLGQELDSRSCAIAEARFMLRGRSADVAVGDTLHRPRHLGIPVELAVCDPPYGQRLSEALPWDPRWIVGPPPKGSADYAWLLHVASSLAPGGRGYVVAPARTLFAGGAERRLRSELVARGIVTSIIGVGPGLAEQTSVPLAVWELTGSPDPAAPLLLIDASREDPAGGGRRSLDESFISGIAALVRQHGQTPAPSGALTPAQARTPDATTDTAGGAAAHAVLPRADVLSADADLTPARWLPRQGPPEVSRVDLHWAMQAVVEVSAELGHSLDTDADVGDVPSLVPPGRPLVSLRGLVEEGAVEIHRGRLTDSDLRSGPVPKGALEVVTARDLRPGAPERPYVLDAPARDVSAPGDLFVLLEADPVRCLVDETGGRVAKAPLVRLRCLGPGAHPEVLAAALTARVNRAARRGSGLTRLHLDSVVLPRLTAEESELLATVLRRSRRRQEALQRAVTAEQHLYQLSADALYTREGHR